MHSNYFIYSGIFTASNIPKQNIIKTVYIKKREKKHPVWIILSVYPLHSHDCIKDVWMFFFECKKQRCCNLSLFKWIYQWTTTKVCLSFETILFETTWKMLTTVEYIHQDDHSEVAQETHCISPKIFNKYSYNSRYFLINICNSTITTNVLGML